jgi:hypothetical protein
LGSRFDALATYGSEALLQHFGERDSDGNFEPAVITLPSGLLLLVDGIVHEIAIRQVIRDGAVVNREACDFEVLTKDLQTGTEVLPMRTQVFIPKYDQPSWMVDPDLSRYGSQFVKLALVRIPFVRLGNLHGEPY